MKGLLYKDFIHLRKFLLAGLFLIVFSLVGVWIFLNRLGEKDFAYGFIVSISTHWFTLITAYFAFQRDERNKWNVYVLSFPVDKRLLVRSRYLFLSCILLTGNLLGFSLSGFSYGFTQGVFLEHCGMIGLTLLLLSAFLPAAYRKGSQDAIWILVLCYILLNVFDLIFGLIGRNTEILLLLNTLVFHQAPVFGLFFALLLFWGSYFLSCKVLETSDVS